jgi:hypothetical protein
MYLSDLDSVCIYNVRVVDVFDNSNEMETVFSIDKKNGLRISEYTFEAATSCSEIYVDSDDDSFYWCGTLVKDRYEDIGCLGSDISSICSILDESDYSVEFVKVRNSGSRVRVKISLFRS